jgi:hypothetical protein
MVPINAILSMIEILTASAAAAIRNLQPLPFSNRAPTRLLNPNDPNIARPSMLTGSALAI